MSKQLYIQKNHAELSEIPNNGKQILHQLQTVITTTVFRHHELRESVN